MERLEQAPEEVRQQWLGMLEGLAEQIHKQQQTSKQMIQEMMDTYMQLLNTPSSYLSAQTEQQQQTIQQTSSSGWSRPNSSARPSSSKPNSSSKPSRR